MGAKPPRPEDYASPQVRDSELGLGRYDPSRAYNGLTLYTPLRPQFPLRLIDMLGNSVHEWTLPFDALEGDVLISLRNLDVLAVLDIEKRVIKWAVRGPWRLQHDPDVLANGKVLLFDNRGDMKNGGTSRILEFDPQTLEITWEYPGDSAEVLYTSIYGSQQRLPNGYTLISESNNGRMIEVTRSGDVVWEYKIPERTIRHKTMEIATVVFAERFRPESLPFLQEP